jgi:hypothetical protein
MVLSFARRSALELPNNHDRSEDLDERVEREASERNGPCCNGSRDQKTNLDDVPPQRRVLQAQTASPQSRPSFRSLATKVRHAHMPAQARLGERQSGSSGATVFGLRVGLQPLRTPALRSSYQG